MKVFIRNSFVNWSHAISTEVLILHSSLCPVPPHLDKMITQTPSSFSWNECGTLEYWYFWLFIYFFAIFVLKYERIFFIPIHPKKYEKMFFKSTLKKGSNCPPRFLNWSIHMFMRHGSNSHFCNNCHWVKSEKRNRCRADWRWICSSRPIFPKIRIFLPAFFV